MAAHQSEDELSVDSQIAELTAVVEHAGATCEVAKDAGISGECATDRELTAHLTPLRLS